MLFAVPELVSAATIKDNGISITETILFTGSFKFETLGTGYECTEVDVPVTVEGSSIEIEDFNITNPTTRCVFYGSAYKNCEFEEHPATKGFPLVADLETGEFQEWLMVTGSTGIGVGRINFELKTRLGAESSCLVTTNDIRLVHEASASTKLEIETNAGFIQALNLTGSIRRETGSPANGTTVTASAILAWIGTFHIEAAKQGTYTVG